jgi:hypothetical protein
VRPNLALRFDYLGSMLRIKKASRYRYPFWTGEGFEASHVSKTFYPKEWPSPLTVENVAGWLWSNMGLPVHGYRILRALQEQSVRS